MDIEKLIEQLNDWNEKYISNLCGDRTIKREEYCIKDDCLIVKAATALSTLQAENKQLRGELEYEQEHANAYHEECGQWEAENEKLYANLARVTAERDAAIEDCSGYCASCRFEKDCAKHDMNDAGPMRWYYGDCEDWEWRGPQKED